MNAAPTERRLLLPCAVVVLALLSACSRQTAETAPRTAPAAAAPATAASAVPAHTQPGPTPAAVPAAGTPSSAPPAARAVAAGFDVAAYNADPAAYCRVVDGSRCHHVAQPAATTPALTSVGAGSLAVPTGGSVQLRAQTDPGMPVSFTSQGLGAFQPHGQSAVTVQADPAGIATATFVASPGTVGHCLIIAGSPVRAGTIQFLVRIQE